jgi:23S rRNA (cytosine1962-C5)-methyltransferase
MQSITVKGRVEEYALHPWIYRPRVVRGEAGPGEAVLVYTQRGKLVGSAFYHPTAHIALRLYSRQPQPFDYLYLKERLWEADQYRRRLFPGEAAYRVVFSEADDLPGLIVDRYGEGLTLQINSLAFEVRRDELADALEDLFAPAWIYERSESPARKKEGLPPVETVLRGTLPDIHPITLEGVRFLLPFHAPQKTGFFLDQRLNYQNIGRLAENRRVLDVFSYVGGFTVHALRGGAREVYAVDQSRQALDLLMENVRENRLDPSRVIPFVGDAFDVLQQLRFTRESFDLIVLDPPSFAREKKVVRRALKGYDELHRLALELLAPHGLLATFSCSHPLAWEDLLGSVERAARRAGRRFRVRGRFVQSPDHPILLGFPPSEYLRGWLLEALD